MLMMLSTVWNTLHSCKLHIGPQLTSKPAFKTLCTVKVKHPNAHQKDF